MDFFQHQERAKKRTVLLVVLYSIAMLFITAAIYLLVFFIVAAGSSNQDPVDRLASQPIDPMILACTLGGVVLLVGGGSLMKTAQLSAGGGQAVAEMLGGRRIHPMTNDPAERRLYNVVEEMSLASGVPIPAVYVMDNEHGINAFAAGLSPNEAVVSVNRGTMELLTRDELQGVVAHEFSHILNGDMRMNLRLIGILFGLQLLVLIGYYGMRMSFYMTSAPRRSNDDKNSGAGIGMVVLLFSIGIMIIGSIGMLFSAIIKAAISRQREFLADASAVQFTRNPEGIAGALKKIGCPNVGSEVSNEHAAEASHLFFGNVCSMFSLGELFATHPNLTTRIRRIDPSFDGRFPERIAPVNFYEEPKKAKTGDPGTARVRSVPGSLGPMGGVLDKMGAPTPAQVLVAGALLENLPQDVSDAARDPMSAKATVYAILLDADAGIRQKQFSSIAEKENGSVVALTQRAFTQLQNVSESARIPLLQRVTATLKLLSVAQYRQFSGVVDSLVAADQKMSLFEYTLKAVLLRDLDIYFGLAKPLSVQYTTLGSVRQPIVAVLAYLAYSGSENSADAVSAFSAAMQELGFNGAMPQSTDCTVLAFDQSLRTLALTAPGLKKQLFSAIMVCVNHDGQITETEGELVRAIAAMLAVPMPNWG